MLPEKDENRHLFHIGSAILSVWFLINILPGIGSLVYILAGNHAPALQYRFSQEEIPTIDLRAVETVDGLAIIANALIVTYCSLAFFAVRQCLLKRQRWAFFSLVSGVLLLQLASYWSDRHFLGKNVWIIHFSSVIFLVGFGLCAYDLFFKKQRVGEGR